MVEYDMLVYMRGLAKGKVIHVKNILDQAADGEITQPLVKMYSGKLKSAYKKFNDCHDCIMAITIPSKRKEQDCKYYEFDTLYDNTTIVLETWIEKLVQAPVNAQPRLQSSSSWWYKSRFFMPCQVLTADTNSGRNLFRYIC